MKKLLCLLLASAALVASSSPVLADTIHLISVQTIRQTHKPGHTTPKPPEIGSAQMYISPSASAPTQIRFTASIGDRPHRSTYNFKKGGDFSATIFDKALPVRNLSGRYTSKPLGKTGCILTIKVLFGAHKARGIFTITPTRASGTFTILGKGNHFQYLEKFTAKKP